MEGLLGGNKIIVKGGEFAVKANYILISRIHSQNGDLVHGEIQSLYQLGLVQTQILVDKSSKRGVKAKNDAQVVGCEDMLNLTVVASNGLQQGSVEGIMDPNVSLLIPYQKSLPLTVNCKGSYVPLGYLGILLTVVP